MSFSPYPLGAYDPTGLAKFSGLLTGLKTAQEQGAPLLDRTMVLFGSVMGDANTHDNHNLPVLLAGGGFKHGQHLAFDKTNNTPLANIYVSMLQRLGIGSEKFATSNGTMRGWRWREDDTLDTAEPGQIQWRCDETFAGENISSFGAVADVSTWQGPRRRCGGGIQ